MIDAVLTELEQRYRDPLMLVSPAVIRWRLEELLRRNKDLLHDNPVTLLQEAVEDQRLYRRLQPLFYCGVDTLFRDPFFFRALGETLISEFSGRALRCYLPSLHRVEELFAVAVYTLENCPRGTLVYGEPVAAGMEQLVRDFVLDEAAFREASASYRKLAGRADLQEYFYEEHGRFRPRTVVLQRIAWNRRPQQAELVICREQLCSSPAGKRRELLESWLKLLVGGGCYCSGWKDPVADERLTAVDRRRGIWRFNGNGCV